MSPARLEMTIAEAKTVLGLNDEMSFSTALKIGAGICGLDTIVKPGIFPVVSPRAQQFMAAESEVCPLASGLQQSSCACASPPSTHMQIPASNCAAKIKTSNNAESRLNTAVLRIEVARKAVKQFGNELDCPKLKKAARKNSLLFF